MHKRNNEKREDEYVSICTERRWRSDRMTLPPSRALIETNSVQRKSATIVILLILFFRKEYSLNLESPDFC